LNVQETIGKTVNGFDNQFTKTNGLPENIRFSSKALAAIINIVLNLESLQLVEGTRVPTAMHGYKKRRWYIIGV
jgi:hypothetical protein